ncbi:unnamed protein product [Protopolystoma xenopodis]|uniref:Uncharacterized protein n=1 Tax=Protopolystoma xenopodis TaxID=117903 RepID=A0A3S5AEF8_9PLAT|nr:unnamed protein product [Protopolystoma xenopodis]
MSCGLRQAERFVKAERLQQNKNQLSSFGEIALESCYHILAYEIKLFTTNEIFSSKRIAEPEDMERLSVPANLLSSSPPIGCFLGHLPIRTHSSICHTISFRPLVKPTLFQLFTSRLLQTSVNYAKRRQCLEWEFRRNNASQDRVADEHSLLGSDPVYPHLVPRLNVPERGFVSACLFTDPMANISSARVHDNCRLYS